MTLRFYATDDMEGATRTLAERNRTVLVVMDYKTVRPIRMQTKAKLADLDIDWCWAWKPDAQVHIDRWQAKGGILQYRTLPRMLRPTVTPCDAIMFVECPLQWDRFESIANCARQEVVIYRPPVWRAHEETVDAMFPSKFDYYAMDSFLDSLDPRTIPFSKFDPCVSFTAQDVKTLFFWTEARLRFVLAAYAREAERWHPYKLRIEPDERHEGLRWAWSVLKQQPMSAPRTHVLNKGVLIPGIPGFKPAHIALARGNYISREDCIYVVNAKRRARDWGDKEAINNARRGRWFRMRQFVDELDEYPC